MARLPGINYSRGVPSLGRQDVYGPLRVAQAQAQAASTLGVNVKEFGDYWRDLEIEEGENQASEALSDLVRQEEEINTNPNIDERLEQLEEIDATIATTYREGLSTVADNAFEKMYVRYSSSVLDRMARNTIFAKNKKVREDTIKSSTELAYMGHREEADIKIGESSVLNDSEKAEAIKENQLQFELGLVERTSLNGTVEDIERILGGITAETYGGPLKGPQRGAAIRQLQNALVLRNADNLAAQEWAKEQYASTLHIAVSRGQAGYAEIEYARSNDLITGPKRTTLTLMVDKQFADNKAQANAIELVTSSMEAGYGLDDRNKDHIDAVDRWYEDVKMRFAEGDSEIDPVLQAANLAGRIGILPSEIESIMHSTAMTGGPEEVAQTANLYRVLKTDAPRSLRKLGAEQKAIYESFLTLVRGNPPEEAVKIARENAYRPASEKADLAQQFQSTIANDRDTYAANIQSWMHKEDQFDISPSPFTGAPATDVQAYNVFKSLHQEYFTLTGGNLSLSADLAKEAFKEFYSTTEINGRQELMAFAPDKEYAGITGSLGADILKDDLNRFYRENDIENGFIRTDENTYSELPGQRTYAVYDQDEFGSPRKTMLRWSPDPKWIAGQRVKLFKEQDAREKKFEDARNEYMKYRMTTPEGGF